MDEATPPDGAQAHMSQTTAPVSMCEEIGSLWKQNEERIRSLRQAHSPVEPTAMHRFNDFPLEIREMIWGLALPKQLLGSQDIVQGVPKDLYVPAVGHVCRESRRFAASKNHNKNLPGGEDGLNGNPRPPSRERVRHPTPASWTWFSPCTDALMITASGFGGASDNANRVLARAAEHIIVEDLQFWEGYYENTEGLFQNEMYDETVDVLMADELNWVQKVYGTPYSDGETYARTHAPVCSRRTVDFCMRQVTQIPPKSPPRFLRRLFGESTFRVVDLGDTHLFLQLLGHELSEGLGPDLFFKCSSELGNAWNIYKSVADKFFHHLRPVFLKTLVSARFEASIKESPEGHGTLPMPFKPGSSKLNMEVAWVRELCERITIRPVHVFVLGEEVPEE